MAEARQGLPQVVAAREALDAYEELASVELAEPRMPGDRAVDPVRWESEAARWRDWYELRHRPAINRWDKAMDGLQDALGPDAPGRHPWVFVPVCRRILNQQGGNSRPSSDHGPGCRCI